MITYVDTSTLLKLLIDEDGSDRAETIWQTSDVMASVSLIRVETRAALAAAARSGRLTAAQHRRAKRDLEARAGDLTLVEVTETLIARAGDLAESEGLRGYDAVHLASALLVGADLVTSADSALCDAAGRLGILVGNPLDHPTIS